MNRHRFFRFGAVVSAALAAALALPLTARADSIAIASGPVSSSGLGFFTGHIFFSPNGFTGGADLKIELTNTSPLANGGFITGFGFNINDAPDGSLKATYVPNSATDPFKNLSGNGLSGSPFGDFEFGTALGGTLLGGGNPNPGIGVGQTRAFLFEIDSVGAGLGENTVGLGASSFLSALSDNKDKDGELMMVRYRGFLDGGSDKVIAVPVPLAAWGGMALLGSLGAAKRLRRAEITTDL